MTQKLALAFGSTFTTDVQNLAVSWTDKVGFDLDTTQEERDHEPS